MKPVTNHFQFVSTLPFSAEKVFSWHLQPGALERMLPRWINCKVIQAGSPADIGSLTVLEMTMFSITKIWKARHVDFFPGTGFVDEQETGPFPYFRHTHRITAAGVGSTLTDSIEYLAPWYIPDGYIQRQLQRQFMFRHKRLLSDLSVMERYPLPARRILISGGSGLVGSSLSSFLKVAGHSVFYLKRGLSDLQHNIIGWDPENLGGYHIEEFEGFDVIIHLAGENIGKRPWSKKQKQRLFTSRCRDTEQLAQILLSTKTPPKLFISASAVGIYGDRGCDLLTEESTASDDFLASLCSAWERASSCLDTIGVRRIQARFGYILDPQGGMLQSILPVFRMGLGGKMGSGRQMIPWVALDDVVYALYHCLAHPELSGPVNVVAPNCVSQQEFAKTLARSIRRFSCCSIPAWVIKLLLPERAEALMLRSAHVVPIKLKKSGYEFIYSDLIDYFIQNV